MAKGNARILVVGAGFAGAALARTLAEAGFSVTVVDKRNHIGGNAYDEVNGHGERIHRYGPHLLHGPQGSEAVLWLSRFTAWTPYEHRVRALLGDGRTTPLPVNRTTLEDVYGLSLDNDAAAEKLLNEKRQRIDAPQNSDELFLTNVGEQLADLFFRPYTKKMWGTPARNLEIGIGARLPVRVNRDDRYFTDTFQALPLDGYTKMFERIFSHENINVTLNTTFEPSMEQDFSHSFLCVPIDAYFGFRLGHLPYRSILFHERRSTGQQAAPVINFTDSGRYTRSTQWSLLPNSGMATDGLHTMTQEEPCDIQQNPGEYFYPVQTKASKALFSAYQALAKELPNTTFCGRTGLFRYIDMLPAVTLHLDMANKFLSDQAPC